jgi:hypothetical protein
MQFLCSTNFTGSNPKGFVKSAILFQKPPSNQALFYYKTFLFFNRVLTRKSMSTSSGRVAAGEAWPFEENELGNPVMAPLVVLTSEKMEKCSKF